MHTWIKPKTNWECRYDVNGNYIGDYFNIEDWQRIIGNIYYLFELASFMYQKVDCLDMGNEVHHEDMPSVIYLNAIESNLQKLKEETYSFEIGKARTYYPNMPAWNYEDLNRIESACLTIYIGLTSQYENAKVLAFTLGGDDFA